MHKIEIMTAGCMDREERGVIGRWSTVKAFVLYTSVFSCSKKTLDCVDDSGAFCTIFFLFACFR